MIVNQRMPAAGRQVGQYAGLTRFVAKTRISSTC